MGRFGGEGDVVQFRDEVQVEVSGFLRLTVDQKAPHTDRLRQIEESSHDVDEQTCPKAVALVPDVHGESSKHGNRLGIAANSWSPPCWNLGEGELAHAPAVVGHHCRIVWLCDHEDAYRSSGVRRSRV